MAILTCVDDPLTKMLNARGLQPLAMPQTTLVAPEVWVFDNTSLVRWGPLASFVTAGSLPTPLEETGMPDLERAETSHKGMSAAGSFLDTALRCIGVTSAPRLDLSFAKGCNILFRFRGITTRGLAPASLGQALSSFAPGIIPSQQVAAGMVQIAYAYAYAETLDMRIATSESASLDLKALQIDTFIDVGGKADVSASDKTTLSFRAKTQPVAFACKVGGLTKKRGKWELKVTETLGFQATANEAEATPYLLRRGAVLLGQQREAE